MYVDTYDQNLGGIGKKLKKAVKRVGRAVGKVAKVAVGGAALFYAPTLALGVVKARQDRLAAEKMRKTQAQIAREQIASQERIATGMVSTPAAPMTMAPSIAPPAALVRATQPTPTRTLVRDSFAPGGEYAPSPEYEPAGSAGTPKWLIPAAVGGAGLLAVLLLKRR